MANYSIQRSDLATGNISVTEALTNATTNVTLIGQNYTGYGDEIATNFLQMLENFASDVDPTTNPRVVGAAIRGQLWYDTTVGTGTLRVHDGTSFVDIAKINSATVESSTLRWNNTNGRYQPEERVRVTDAGALIIDAAAAGTNAVTFSHAAGDLEIAGAGTTNINVTGVTAVTMPSLELTTVLDEIYGGTGVVTYAQGDILYASAADTLVALNAGTNGQVLTMGATVPGWVSSGAGVTTLTTLTDVDTSGVITGSLMYKTAGDWTDTPGLTWNVIAGNLSATRFGNILEANLIDRSAPGTISGTATFDGATPIVATAGDIDVTNGFGFVATEATTAIAIRADDGASEITITHSGTPDWNITGLGIASFDNPVHATSGGAEAFRIIGDAATWATADSYISFYDSDASEFGLQIGTLVTDGQKSRINSRLGDLELYASSTLMLTLTSTTAAIYNSAGTAMAFRNPFTVGTDATTSATVGDINNNQYNVGYNETPYEAGVGQNINTGSFSLLPQAIGKMISRTTSTSRTITLDNDTDIPVGATTLIHNGASGGTLSINIGTITYLDWIDGSGSLPTRTSNRTLDYNSIVTIRKVNSSTWQIWGNGIT